MKNRIVVSYSGGKDSTLALYRLIQSGEWEIDSLLTTVTENVERTSIHGVRQTLLDEQAQSIGIPVRKIHIPEKCTNETYENIMGDAVNQMVQDGVTHMMFGDIHLKDVKEYREKMLKDTPLQPVFPLWGEEPKHLIDEFISLGFKTIVTCVDSQQLDPSFVGRVINQTFLNELPENVDVCGENGEYHSFVFNGPIFQKQIDFEIAKTKTVRKDIYTNEDRFYFVDLLPKHD